MSAELSIVFVDDEPRILDGLRRQLRTRRESWDMRFASSGAEALQMLAARPADVVISDMRMPGMTGGLLLQRVLETHPQTTRIILSGQTDQIDLLRDVGSIHQYLQKPCDPGQLCAAIKRTQELAQQLRQPHLRLAASQITSLPPASKTYQRLMSELAKDDACISRIAQTVAQDPALAAKLLQLVNSAFFGMPRKVSSPQEAVVLLGLTTVRSLIVAGQLFPRGAGGPSRALEQVWHQSVQVGDAAGRLARLDGAPPAVQEQARLAGLLSLVGRAILITADPAAYANVVNTARSTGRSLSECEAEHFKADQDAIAAYALGLWAFSNEVVSSVAYQSAPTRCQDVPIHHPLAYVHLARVLTPPDSPKLDEAFIAARGLTTLIEAKERVAA